MEILVRIVVLVLATATFFRNIANFPLRNWDEAWYAEIIKNIASGQYGYLVPFWNGQYYFDKPPLYFWLSLPFFRLFGPGEWQARIVSAIAAIFAAFFIYLIAKRFFKQRVAVLSVVVFLTLGQVVIRFAHGNLDALAVCLILATLFFYLTGRRFSWFLAGIVLGLTYLAKGWILGLLPILLMFLFEYFLLGKNFKRLIFAVLVSVLLVCPYYILGYLSFGQKFISWYLFSPTAGLVASEIFSFEYFFNLARDIGFWFIPFVLGLGFVGKINSREKIVLALLVFASFTFLLGISLFSGKLGWYALPVYPFVAIFLAYFVEKLLTKNLMIAFGLAVVVTALQIYNVNRIENIYPDRSKVGANLGKAAHEFIPKEDLLILDDRDLPAFLFYSGHEQVFVVSGSSHEPWEWWVVKYEDLPSLLASNNRVWIVTKESNLVANAKLEAEVEGYKFLKVYF